MVEITRLFWKKVFTSDGLELGELNSADVDLNTWQITNLFVYLSDEASRVMGFKHPYLGRIMVCLPVSTVKTATDRLTLGQSMQELQNLKQCKE